MNPEKNRRQTKKDVSNVRSPILPLRNLKKIIFTSTFC